MRYKAVCYGIRIGIALLAALLLASPSWAKLAPFDGIGGPGGAPFHLDCGESGLLIGITGRSGIVIDQIGGVCVKVDPISGVWLGGSYETNHHGGTGGQPFNKRCPVGQALWGLEGSVNNFNGTPVLGSLGIKCIEIGVHPERAGATIQGTRLIDYYGDPDPLKVQEQQDYCDTPHVGTDVHRESRVWNRVGVALEGRAGLFVDHIHIVCGSLPADTAGYRVQFKPNSNISVPEGTPLQLSWHAGGVTPELTPNLQYSWDLQDWTHTSSSSTSLPGGGTFGIGGQPTTIQNACAYAAQPCTSGWFGSTSSSQVTFHSLPPARYELRLTVKPTVPTSIQSQATVTFEILPNQLVEIKVNPGIVHVGQGTTATVVLEGPAQPRGKTIYLSSSNPQLVPVPPSIIVPGGAAIGTISLHAASGLFSGQATITASTIPFLALQSKQPSMTSNLAAGVLSRGIEGTEQPVAPVAEKQSEPEGERASVADESLSSDTPDSTITERGIGAMAVRPSIALSQANQTVNSLPKPQPSGVATQMVPGGAAASILALPGTRKQTVLTIQAELGIQQNIKPLITP